MMGQAAIRRQVPIASVRDDRNAVRVSVGTLRHATSKQASQDLSSAYGLLTEPVGPVQVVDRMD